LGTDDKRYMRYFFNVFYYLGKKISTVWGKIEILDGTPIGKGFFIKNEGGVFLGAVEIGENCTIANKVTMGMDQNGFKPTLQNNVCIGENSVIYGRINVGDGCVIDKNSVLSKSVPAKLLLSGNPAKVIKKNINTADYCLGGSG